MQDACAIAWCLESGDINFQVIQSLDQLIRQWMVAYQLPGLAVGIVKDNQIIYA